MRRYWVVALAVLTLLGVFSPPAFAQAPVPKVTITGLIDNLVNFGRNMSQYDVALGGITNNADDAMYGRTRGRFDIIGELGKARAVLGIELDLSYGQAGATVNGLSKNVNDQIFGTSAGFPANNDVSGIFEIKWLYVDFPFTGPGSLLPFIPWTGSMQVGGQPYGLGLKPSILADSDFSGSTLRMTISPTFDFSFTYAQFEEASVGSKVSGSTAVSPIGFNTAPSFGRGDDWGIIFKANWQARKELRVSPIYAFQELQGTTSTSIRRAVGGYGVTGTNFAPDLSTFSFPAAGGTEVLTTCLGGHSGTQGGSSRCVPTEELRHTIGLDARWTQGPWYIAPTAFYQFGSRERFQSPTDPGAIYRVLPGTAVPATAATIVPGQLRRKTADISAWIVDVESGYRTGPLLLQLRAMYTSGNKVGDNLNERINYYQPFQVDSTYWTGWGEVTALSFIDYFQGLYTPIGGLFQGNNVGYDRYGRAQFAVKATYDLTPQISPYLIVAPMWTAQSVPTEHGFLTSTGVACNSENPLGLASTTGVAGTARVVSAPCTRRDEGNASYLGTDVDFGFTYRFAPGLVFDWVYGVLFPGHAYDTNRFTTFGSTMVGVPGTVKRHEADNVYTTTARVRYSF